VNKILPFETKSILWLETQTFDWMINLDKDDEAIAIVEKVRAKKITGFRMGAYGKCRPQSDKPTTEKWMTGLWDDLNRANRKNYMTEIFEICGYKYADEGYLLPAKTKGDWGAINRAKTVVGLNTGCGARWTTRLWGEKNWTELAKALTSQGFETVLLGGPQEDEQNKRIAQASGAKYLGHYDLNTFIDLMDQCSIIVSQVTMAMHIAIGLGKKMVLLNNIFNSYEFHLYGKGTFVQPDLPCLGCFKQRFDENCPVGNCMELIRPERVAEKVKGLCA
jgi:ADP-heptose:LPS heptosyltransferase